VAIAQLDRALPLSMSSVATGVKSLLLVSQFGAAYATVETTLVLRLDAFCEIITSYVQII
jgi:hypothetical protein